MDDLTPARIWRDAPLAGSPEPARMAIGEAQRTLWAAYRLAPEDPSYNMVLGGRLVGGVDPDILAEAFRIAIFEREALHTAYREDDAGTVHMVRDPSFTPDITITDRAPSDDADRIRWFEAAIDTPFVLEAGLSCRVRILVEDGAVYFATVVHHIAGDFASVELLCERAFSLAEKLREGVSPVPHSPGDFWRWLERQRDADRTLDQKRLEAFWGMHLAQAGGPPRLFNDPAPGATVGMGKEIDLPLGPELSTRIHDMAKKVGISPLSLLTAGYQLFLHRWSGQERFVIGTPVSGRHRRSDADLVGYTINVLPWIADFSGDPTGTELARGAHRNLMAMLRHRQLPTARVLALASEDRLQLRHMTTLVPVGGRDAIRRAMPLEMEMFANQRGAAHEINLRWVDHGDQLVGQWRHDPRCFSPETAARMRDGLLHALAQLIETPDAPISTLSPDPSAVTLTATPSAAGVSPGTALALFERGAADYPDRIAVQDRSQTLSYKELNTQAIRLAHRLAEGNGTTGDVVALHLPRGAAMAVAMVAVWKAGRAFLCLDPAQPAARKAMLIVDSGALAVIGEGATPPEGLEGAAWFAMNDGANTNPQARLPQVQTDDGAYVIYTSGSTGRPKAVRVTHGNLAHYVTGMLDVLRPAEGSRFATLASPAADLGFTSWFGALLGRGTLHVIDDALADDPAALADHLGKHPVDILKIVPSHLAALLAVPDPARLLPRQWLVLGGEAPGETLIADVARLAPDCRILNHYGPTETTVGCLAGEIVAGEAGPHPLGRPLPGNHVMVVDRHLNPVPVGVAGELLVGGQGVAQGYMRNPAATADRFIPDPAATDGSRLYRTGDRVRMLSDGRLLFLGRADDQVKIRGYRVEPGETEAWLRRQSGVREATVFARPAGPDSSGPLRLLGFVTPATVDTATLLAAMAADLPDAMVPSYLMALDALPRLSNGKVDRRALPDPALPATQSAGTANLSPLEARIGALWCETLGIVAVGPDDDFFAIGGDSILALQIIAKARPAGIALTPRLFFDQRTLRAIAAELPQEAQATTRDRMGNAPELAPFALAKLSDADVAALGAAGVEDAYPLTPLQEGLLFHSLLRPDSGSYVNQLVLDADGPFDKAHFISAFCDTIAAHAIMRTGFLWEGRDAAIQTVRLLTPEALRASAVRSFDWRGYDETERHAALDQLLRDDRAAAFDLDTPPLTRLVLIRSDESRWILVWTRHHLVVDGWCSILLLDEMLERYRALLDSVPPVLVARRPFRDHLAWLARQDRDASGAYWEQALDGLDGAGLAIPAPVADEDATLTQAIALDREETARLVEAAQRHRVTLNTLAQAAWALTLATHTGRGDVIFGVTSAGRPADLAGADDMIGLFITTLPLRVRLAGKAGAPAPCLRDFLTTIQSNSAAMRDHEHMPLVDIGRTAPQAIQFDTLLVFQNLPGLEGRQRRVGELTLRQRDNVERTHYGLTVEVFPGDTLGISIDAQGWDRASLERLAQGFLATLLAMTSDGAATLDTLTTTGAAERALLDRWASTAAPYALQPDWVVRVAANVAVHPDRIAVRHGDAVISYGELWHRSAVLARGLLGAGAQRDEPVALLLPRGLDLYCLMVAVLRAGCGWMPLDPSHPQARWDRVLARAGNPLVVRDEGIAFTGAATTFADLMSVGQASDAVIDRPSRGDQLAYILFTSGSTGEPKGAMITRDGMLNNMLAKVEPLGLGPDDVIAQTAPSCFDISVWQTLTGPLVGACTQIISDHTVRDPDLLIETLDRSGATIFEPVPSLMRALCETLDPSTSAAARPLSRMRWTLPTGEALSPGDAQRWFAAFPGGRLMNAYGPAECADDVAFHPIHHAGEIAQTVPIGRPTSGAVLRVVDDGLRPVPVGVTGEIVVGGVGVGRGYAGDPRTTATVFVPDPNGPPGSRRYRTGDLARWTAQGVLEWGGRRDFQIKVRGHRIEAGEIETWLERHDAVARAVVMAHQDRLAVWWQPARKDEVSGHDALTDKLTTYLAALLPPYMVPDLWISVTEWPLNANGKLDRRALPAPAAAETPHGGEPLATPTEFYLARHWAELLGTGVTDRSADFFALGGHSLAAARLASRLRRDGWRDLPLCAIFDKPCLRTLAAFLDASEKQDDGAPSLVSVPRTAVMPLAPIQQRLWLVDRLGNASGAYAMAASFEIAGPIDPGALRAALSLVLSRHEILRTAYPDDDEGDPVAVIAPTLVLDMPLHDLSGLRQAERMRQAEGIAADHAARPFDLASGPLVRAELIRLDEQLWHMPIAMHHIIADGWSVGVFARDLAAAYRAVRAGHSPQWRPLAIQYADYAAWQQAALSGERLEAEQIFWRDRLHGAPTTLTLPIDRPRPPIASTAGDSLQFDVPDHLATALEQWASARGATCFMALLTLFLTLLHQESGADDLVIGTDVAGRPAPELEELIGFFVNVVPIRSRAGDGDSFNARLERVRQEALDTFAHEQLPFDRIVEAVGARQDRSRNPLVQHLLVLQNVPDGALHLDDCTIRQLPAADRHSKFDIALFIEPARPAKDGSPARPMKADWVFASALYDSTTIRRLHGRWIALMEKAVTDPDQPALTALAAAPTPRAPNAPAFNLTTLDRKATDRFAPTGVHQSMLAPGCAMPAVLQPAAPGMAPSDWAKSNVRLIEELLLDRGALLFRGFDLPDAPAFRAFAEAMEPAGLYGAYGDLPPSKEAEGLYNSTPYPEQEMIFFHNESSHLSQWPRKQWFFAQEVATSGGCTPIVDCRAMLRRLPRALVEEFERRGLLYVRTFTPHLDIGWRDFFRTDSREEVNARCARGGMECYWLDEETPQTRLAAPAVIRHPTTGERVFFNQVQLHHPQCLDPEIRSDLLDIVGIDRFPRNVLFGDGETIADETMALIGRAYEDCAVRFPWQRGDMLMLDNMLTAHARDPFEGSRRVFVAMAGLVSRSDIAHASQEKVA